jgi:hypothetical protein
MSVEAMSLVAGCVRARRLPRRRGAQPVDVGVLSEPSAGDDRQILAGRRPQAGAIAGVPEVEVAIDEHEAVPSAAAQRQGRAKQHAAVAAQHQRAHPAVEHRTSGVRELPGLGYQFRSVVDAAVRVTLEPIGRHRYGSRVLSIQALQQPSGHERSWSAPGPSRPVLVARVGREP